MDFIARVKEYLENKLTLSASIVTPILDSNSKSIAIRQTPSSENSRYIAGKTFNFSFQVLVKDTHISAYNTTQAIFMALDGLQRGDIVSNNGSFTMIKCECSTLPNWVEKNDKNEHTYTAIFTAELMF